MPTTTLTTNRRLPAPMPSRAPTTRTNEEVAAPITTSGLVKRFGTTRALPAAIIAPAPSREHFPSLSCASPHGSRSRRPA